MVKPASSVLRALRGRIGLVLIIALRRLEPRLQPVVEPAQMDVHVDEAGHDRAVAKVDDPGAGHVDIAARTSAMRRPRTTTLAFRRGGWPGTAISVPAWMTVTGSAAGAGAGARLSEGRGRQGKGQRGERSA